MWYCKGPSIAPLWDYAHNPIFQVLPTKKQYFKTADENIFVDLRRETGYINEIEKLNRYDSDLSITITLKNAAAKKKKKKKKNEIACKWILSR